LVGIRIPTVAEEHANPGQADQVYETCVAVLRGKTRNREKFPLVFVENCNYGFCRNLWGLKPLGLPLAIGGTIAVAVLIVTQIGAHDPVSALTVLLGAANLALLALWLFWITPRLVRIPAEAYADRLLETIEDL